MPQDKVELAIAPPKYMLPEMANRVAAAGWTVATMP